MESKTQGSVTAGDKGFDNTYKSNQLSIIINQKC